MITVNINSANAIADYSVTARTREIFLRFYFIVHSSTSCLPTWTCAHAVWLPRARSHAYVWCVCMCNCVCVLLAAILMRHYEMYCNPWKFTQPKYNIKTIYRRINCSEFSFKSCSFNAYQKCTQNSINAYLLAFCVANSKEWSVSESMPKMIAKSRKMFRRFRHTGIFVRPSWLLFTQWFLFVSKAKKKQKSFSTNAHTNSVMLFYTFNG